MNNRRISKGVFLTFAIVASICLLVGLSHLESAPRIVATDTLSEFWGGAGTTVECHECVFEMDCYLSDRCSNHVGDETACRNAQEVDNEQNGWDIEYNYYRDALTFETQRCALEYQCRYVAGSCMLGSYSKVYALSFCDS